MPILEHSRSNYQRAAATAAADVAWLRIKQLLGLAER
jgi:hypothetical protein